MRIGINLTHLNPGVNGGIEHCIRSWLHYFPIVAPQHTYVVFGREDILKTIDSGELYEMVTVPFWLENLNALTLCLEELIPQKGIDVWWSPLMVLDPVNLSIPSAFVLADMQHEYYPDFFSKEELFWRKTQIALSAAKASIIITISEDAKKDIVKYLDVDSDKVRVAHLDSEFWFAKPLVKRIKENVKKKYKLPSRYIFFPANTWPHKNHINLLRAFNLIKNVYPELAVVFTGAASNAHSDIQAYIEEQSLADRVRYLGHISREDMPYIYANAEMLVFASLFEGFGIPLVEAMRSGCPIIASSVTSIPEVAGDAALYVDPKNPLEIAEKIGRLLDDPVIRRKLLACAQQQVKKFSYAESAKLIVSSLEQITISNWHGEPCNNFAASLETPLVSIITPSYNQGEFIEDTIKSVMEQTYKNIEYIIVDGGSTDESVRIIKKYAAQYPGRIQWISEKDHGQSDAINKGLRRASGEIVAWLNSDDVYNLQAIAKVVDFFHKNKEISFVHGQGYHVDKDNVFIENYPSRPCDFISLHNTCSIAQPTAFWRKGILQDIGYLNEKLHYAMDYDYWIRISRKYTLGFIPDHLASTRLYEATKTMGQRHKVHKEIIQVVKANYKDVHANWIYAYAHTYPIMLKNDRKGCFKNICFTIFLVCFSATNFLRYNKRIPLNSIRLFLGWLSGALFPNKKR